MSLEVYWSKILLQGYTRLIRAMSSWVCLSLCFLLTACFSVYSLLLCHGRKTYLIFSVGLILTPAVADWHHCLTILLCMTEKTLALSSVDSPVGSWRLWLDRLLRCKNTQLSLPFLLWNLLDWQHVCLIPRALWL